MTTFDNLIPKLDCKNRCLIFGNQLINFFCRLTDHKVAVKRMSNIFDDEIDAKRAYREMHILRYTEKNTTFHEGGRNIPFYTSWCFAA